jgi:hypothetical protein
MNMSIPVKVMNAAAQVVNPIDLQFNSDNSLDFKILFKFELLSKWMYEYGIPITVSHKNDTYEIMVAGADPITMQSSKAYTPSEYAQIVNAISEELHSSITD